MKKFVCLAVALVLVFALGACSSGDNDSSSKGTTLSQNVSTSISDVKKEVSLKAIMSEIESSVELPDMYDLNSVDMLMENYGIESADVKSFAAKVNGMGIKCDEIVMIETTGAEAVDRVRGHLQDRLDDVKNQMNDYLPEEYKIASACFVEVRDNFVTLFISDSADKMNEIFNSAF